MRTNLLLRTDSYKFTHWKQYPAGTTQVYSYLESRGGMFAQTLFFGLQYYLKHYLQGVVFNRGDIDQAEDFCRQHFRHEGYFNRAGWEYVLQKHGGRLPLKIVAVPEGTVVPVSNVLMTVENTDSSCPWLTNYLETLLLKVWYPITVATLSYEMKKMFRHFLELSGEPSLLPFKVHDFGYRGVSSEETAAIGAAAHLINFQGTDTVAGIEMLKNFYGAVAMPGFSVPAAEHSTITAWGREGEADAYQNMLTQFPEGIVACVSDSYDILKACAEIWGTRLRQAVLDRNGLLVIRPDSGDPKRVLLEVFQILSERFGFEMNSKGYRVLNPKVRVIQGDGINYWTMGDILTAITKSGWSADNLTFGIGGALLQQLNRDTQKFALKCSSVTVNGVQRDVYKDPATDHAKASKPGRLALVRRSKHLETISLGPQSRADDDLLQTVFLNGDLVKEYSLDYVRATASGSVS
jgi:nicotinamide phosphoribosyltransferase